VAAVAGVVAAIPSPAAADSVSTTIPGAGGTSVGNPVAVAPDGSTIYVVDPAADTL
jgi:hypothetical protein